MRPSLMGGRFQLIAGAAGVMIVMVGVLLSPWLLRRVLGRRSSWADVGNVGQAYGGAAAVLAALALVGVCVSVFVQWHSARLQRAGIARERHFELAKLAFEHEPLTHLTWGGFDESESKICRYVNLWLSYWFWLWSLHDLDEATLRRVLAAEVFAYDCVFRWWEGVRSQGGWTSTSSRRRVRQFNRVINDVYQELVGLRSESADVVSQEVELPSVSNGA